ncbi:MAG TPA: phasin family protein [Anaerolineae bacterium]|nr:phasin family protein [Anaerolineae bacterium]
MENVVEQVKPEVEKAKDVVTEEQNKLQEALHRLMLATVGTVGLVQDELEHFVNKAVERGEIAEKEARKTVRDVTDKRKGAEKEVDKRFEDMLVKLNIPTKNDITALNDKIADLTKKVESLKN